MKILIKKKKKRRKIKIRKNKYGIKTISYTNTLSKGNSDIYIEEPSQEFRAVWSSPWGGDSDLITFHSEEQFKQLQGLSQTDLMEMFGIDPGDMDAIQQLNEALGGEEHLGSLKKYEKAMKNYNLQNK